MRMEHNLAAPLWSLSGYAGAAAHLSSRSPQSASLDGDPDGATHSGSFSRAVMDIEAARTSSRPEDGDTAQEQIASQDSHFFGEDGFTIGDFIDAINPLHHIPVVADMYRAITGDDISPAAQIAGGGIYGGPIGLVSAIGNAAVQEITGDDIAGNLIAMVTGQAVTGEDTLSGNEGTQTAPQPVASGAGLSGNEASVGPSSLHADLTGFAAANSQLATASLQPALWTAHHRTQANQVQANQVQANQVQANQVQASQTRASPLMAAQPTGAPFAALPQGSPLFVQSPDNVQGSPGGVSSPVKPPIPAPPAPLSPPYAAQEIPTLSSRAANALMKMTQEAAAARMNAPGFADSPAAPKEEAPIGTSPEQISSRRPAGSRDSEKAAGLNASRLAETPSTASARPALEGRTAQTLALMDLPNLENLPAAMMEALTKYEAMKRQ